MTQIALAGPHAKSHGHRRCSVYTPAIHRQIRSYVPLQRHKFCTDARGRAVCTTDAYTHTRRQCRHRSARSAQPPRRRWCNNAHRNAVPSCAGSAPDRRRCRRRSASCARSSPRNRCIVCTGHRPEKRQTYARTRRRTRNRCATRRRCRRICDGEPPSAESEPGE